MDIKELKRHIIEYDLYEVIDDAPYGAYFLTILNEGDKILIIVRDNEGLAAWAMDKDEFLNISTDQELEEHINNILYYNYNVYE